jgi:hypothetical protein
MSNVDLVDEVSLVAAPSASHTEECLIMSSAITDWELERSLFASDVELLKNPVNRSPVNPSKKNASKESLLSKFRAFVQGSLP